MIINIEEIFYEHLTEEIPLYTISDLSSSPIKKGFLLNGNIEIDKNLYDFFKNVSDSKSRFFVLTYENIFEICKSEILKKRQNKFNHLD